MLLVCILCTLPFDVHKDWDAVIYSCAWFPKLSVFLEGWRLEEQCSALSYLSTGARSHEREPLKILQDHIGLRLYIRSFTTAHSCTLWPLFTAEPMMLGSFNWRHPVHIQQMCPKPHSCADICLVYHRRFILGKTQPPTSFCWSPQCFITSCSLKSRCFRSLLFFIKLLIVVVGALPLCSADDHIWPYVHQNGESQQLWMESAACNRLKMSQSSLKACSHISVSHKTLARFMERRKCLNLADLCPSLFPYLV